MGLCCIESAGCMQPTDAATFLPPYGMGDPLLP
jgi:hypothetical protein